MRMARGITINNLVKHAFISGMPGYGKTTAVLNILIQLHRLGIPFIVFEPVKTEYRIFKTLKNHVDEVVRSLAESLEIYTPGNELISPLRFNPLLLQPGIGCYEHIENLLASFMATFPIFGSIPALIGEALELVYEKFPDPNQPPTMSDLVVAVKEVLTTTEYTSDTGLDMRAILKLRLGSLTRRDTGKVFQCNRNIPSMDRLMKVPTLIEMDGLPQDPTCLLTLFLLTAIREYIKTSRTPGSGLQHVLVIEEAHSIVGPNTDAAPSEIAANPKAYAADFICRMLTEVRALGEGIIICDQHPSKVAAEVIKSTASKLAFLQVANEDREQIGGTMLFGPTEMEDIARLLPGEAFIITEGYHGPRRIHAVNVHQELDLDSPPVNEEILPHISEDSWFQEAASARMTAELEQLKSHMDQFDDQRISIDERLISLIELYPRVLERSNGREKTRQIDALCREAQKLSVELSTAYRDFVRGPYRAFLDDGEKARVKDKDLLKLREALVRRFESVIEKDTKEFIERNKERIREWKESKT